jgi:hypothetical protein
MKAKSESGLNMSSKDFKKGKVSYVCSAKEPN